MRAKDVQEAIGRLLTRFQEGRSDWSMQAFLQSVREGSAEETRIRGWAEGLWMAKIAAASGDLGGVGREHLYAVFKKWASDIVGRDAGDRMIDGAFDVLAKVAYEELVDYPTRGLS